jgi:hypothetical protein
MYFMVLYQISSAERRKSMKNPAVKFVSESERERYTITGLLVGKQITIW